MNAYKWILFFIFAGALIGWISLKDTKTDNGVNDTQYVMARDVRHKTICQPVLIEKTISMLMAGQSFHHVFSSIVPINSDSIQYDLCQDVIYSLVDKIKSRQYQLTQSNASSPKDVRHKTICQPVLIEKTISMLMAGQSFRQVFPLIVPINSDSIQHDLCQDVIYSLVDTINSQNDQTAKPDASKGSVI